MAAESKIIDGKKIAETIRAEVKIEVDSLRDKYGKVRACAFHVFVTSRKTRARALPLRDPPFDHQGSRTCSRTSRGPKRFCNLCTHEETGMFRGRH